MSMLKIPKPFLPYAMNALEPYISSETLNFHFGKHHQTYYNNLKQFKEIEGKSLEDIIKNSSGPLFNNAAQHFNHNFYWKSMNPTAGGMPEGEVRTLIEKSFGSFEKFKTEFSNKGAAHFGSGWMWLVLSDSNKLAICEGHDAMNPIKSGCGIPILTMDVWEHAYYIDTRNARPEYIKNWFNVVNWDFANLNLKQ